jgi:hypothetical protein
MNNLSSVDNSTKAQEVTTTVTMNPEQLLKISRILLRG